MAQSEPQTRPPRVHWLMRFFAKTVLRIFGWTTEVDETLVHGHARYIIIAAPHTSNWDAIFGGLGFIAEDIGTSIIIKSEWTKMPVIGRFITAIGGIGIERSGPLNTIHQIVRLFEQNSQFVLVITPEGTRKKTEGWKKGFYYIAKKANVPMMLGYPDYRRKVCCIAPIVVFPSGDIEADMQQFSEVLDKVSPKYPSKRTEMRFRSRVAK